MTRREVRRGIAEFFGGTTYDEIAEIYRPTPLKTYGLAGVRPYYPVRVEDSDRLIGLDPGAQMGAVMGVHLAETTSRRLTTGGFMQVPIEVQLYVYHLAMGPKVEASQAALDDLAQAIEDLMRGDPTLGGVVVQGGEGARGVTVSMSVPVTEPGASPRVLQDAVISFAAEVYPFYTMNP